MGTVIRTDMGMATVIRILTTTGIRMRWFTRDRTITIIIGITDITGPTGRCATIEFKREERFSGLSWLNSASSIFFAA
jgi:hypothetical protein